MGDLALDSAVAGGEGRYRATLSRDWQIWSPNGGYLAVIALRAAGAETRLRRPASFYAQFLAAAEYGEVELSVETLRETRRTACARVVMTQGDRTILAASTWIVDAEIPGLAHEAARMPEVPRPEELRPFSELRADDWPWYPFWKNFDARPTRWVPPEEWTPGEPVARDWLRFVPRATFDDPFLEAGRALLLCDTYSWPAAARAHRDERFIAPNVDVAVQFHQSAQGSEWLLADAFSPLAAGGLVGCRSQIWTAQGQLVASGACQLLCRPVPAAAG